MNVFASKKAVKDQYTLKDQTAKRWAGIAMILAFLAAGLGMGCMYLATQATVIPYIVQVDEHGYEIAVGPLQTAPVDDRVVMARLARFVESWRSIVSDAAAQKNQVFWVYTSIPSGSSAQAAINEYYQSDDVFEQIAAHKTRTVTVKTVLKISSATWRVEWEEQNYERGVQKGKSRWTGLFQIGITPPSDMKNVLQNPLGIFVTEYSATPDFSPVAG